MTYILGVETSCDETAASVLAFSKAGEFKILSNIISSQIAIHQRYQGVVPEIAAREHVLNILPVINEALREAKIKSDDLAALAVTAGPGLITSLLSGVETVRTLAYAWGKPVIAVNHIAGHLSAAFISQPKTKFPAVALTVSGGHTNIVYLSNYNKYKLIGETLDDAAGEAFDKGAKMLGVGYPGGPIVSRLAKDYHTGDKNNLDIKLPRPMLHKQGFDFSFSGLKTALLYQIKKDKNYQKHIPEYCHELQQAIIDVLIAKTIKAAKLKKAQTVILSGGVSANIELRRQLAERVEKELPGVEFLVPQLEYTTDNAAMVAMAGYYLYQQKKFVSWPKLKATSSLDLA
ncbi:MAG TPA: tRNA (adenosine(37)-N6)-threonylcarbamoyltransferase complex transferase subunit TsaD [bacterium]|nr:tRNA (adenosine(37)-N6)-threonylcarbamoyltransferase complex transferase subunit TsaD [bacterium]HPT29378.1 tRNA (adenosine(37)-N6)-threonylcarbamoyltransferase complex transferase subunit TsaD [bacterium]